MADLRRRKPEDEAADLKQDQIGGKDTASDSARQKSLRQKLANELATADSSDHVNIFYRFYFPLFFY